jgi:hypothetical protein
MAQTHTPHPFLSPSHPVFGEQHDFPTQDYQSHGDIIQEIPQPHMFQTQTGVPFDAAAGVQHLSPLQQQLPQVPPGMLTSPQFLYQGEMGPVKDPEYLLYSRGRRMIDPSSAPGMDGDELMYDDDKQIESTMAPTTFLYASHLAHERQQFVASARCAAIPAAQKPTYRRVLRIEARTADPGI